MKRVFIIAGESSGDLHGSSLMNRMKALDPDISFKGIGGILMVGEGLDVIRHAREMNFMGLVEVLRHLPFIRAALHDCESLLDSWKPDLVILIDYPGFNLKIAPMAKKRGIPVMYYISPQLWAWHKSRVKLIHKYIDRMVVLFDFEKEFYRKYGVDADFVGHPLIDAVKLSESRESFRESLGVEDGVPLVGILPGSRMQEIERILPTMISAINVLRNKIGNFVPVIGCAPELDKSVYDSYLKDTGIIPLYGKAYEIMAHSDAVTVTSGTATLEAGILGAPMVIVYKTSLLTYLIGRSLVTIDNIGLINIVARGRIVPELWQNDVTPENIASHLEKLIRDLSFQGRIKDALTTAKGRLGEPGASGRTAKIALEMLS